MRKRIPKRWGEAGLRLVLNEMGQPTGLSVSAPKLVHRGDARGGVHKVPAIISALKLVLLVEASRSFLKVLVEVSAPKLPMVC